MALVDYAKSELERAGLFDKDSDYEGMIGTVVMQIIEVFSAQGHSGMSAELVTQILEKLLRFEPLTPLTGEDDEWIDVSEVSGEPMWQNNRCYRVFKDKDGNAFDNEAKVFIDPEGHAYTNSESRVPITFPYTPKIEFVQVEEEPEDGRAGQDQSESE